MFISPVYGSLCIALGDADPLLDTFQVPIQDMSPSLSTSSLTNDNYVIWKQFG